MNRRSLIRRFWSLAAILPSLRTWAQTRDFPGDHVETLRALAGVVLPSSLGERRISEIADAFTACVRGYRAGAEMEHGYGLTRLRYKGPSPAPAYLRQLAALGENPLTRENVEAAIVEAKVDSLPAILDGRHVATDLMAFFFHSSEANDLCYKARIGRDDCAGLRGSDKVPTPLR